MGDEKPLALVDTDVVSNMIKSTTIGLEYLRLSQGYQLGVAFVTAAELRFGAAKRRLGARRNLYLEDFLAGCPFMPFVKEMDRVYARVMLERERMGRRLEKADGWIATTAIYYDVPLITHDRDFVGTSGLRIISASEEVRAAQLRLPPIISSRPLNLDNSCRCSM
jgi:predicted nucleic acid-binding protein